MEPFSTPFAIDRKIKRYGCYIDVKGVPHEASWTGDWAIFEFTDTSQIHDFRLVPLKLTIEISTVWKSSALLAFGSHASVRLVKTNPSLVVKIAQPTEKCRRLVEREFNIMHDLSTLDAVAQVEDQPLEDQDGVFGFRLERLNHVEPEDLRKRIREVEGLLDSLHKAGYCHGDCSPSNIMQNQKGRLVFIDLGFAGPLGDNVPEGFSKLLFPGGLFTANVDRERVEEWAMCRH
jgi:serine/threonine protein kinase